ncbi:MAG: preprotein translocase YidC [Dethiosulfovibrio peptidovorans]|nr:MAG: preprotein translocase YidC [Dethiosulfovibrio peptidovorans]
MWEAASNAMYGLLSTIHNFVGSWGLAVIVLTLLVRLALHPLNHKQLVSMQKMQKLQPRIKMLQEKYKNDKEGLSRETMALYKENKVNPAAGCLPLLVQLPILILLFRVLMNSDFGGATFLGVTLEGSVLSTMGQALGLVAPEGGQIGFLAVLKGISANPVGLTSVGAYAPNLALLLLIIFVTWYQQRMTSASNPQMAMMSWFMPLFMGFICLSLPGGVMLYWGASSFIGVGQQWWVLHKTAQEGKPALFKEKPAKDKQGE